MSEALCKYYQKKQCIHPSKKPLLEYLEEQGIPPEQDATLSQEQIRAIDAFIEDLPTGTDGSFNIPTRKMPCTLPQTNYGLHLCDKSEIKE